MSEDDHASLDRHSDETGQNTSAADAAVQPWQPDDEAPDCSLCGGRFSYNPLHPQRRHHCRVCGALVCSSCSESRVYIEDKNAAAERACRLCGSAHQRLQKLFNFVEELDNRVKTLNQLYCKTRDRSTTTTTDDLDSGMPPSSRRSVSDEDVQGLICKLIATTDDLEQALQMRRLAENQAYWMKPRRSVSSEDYCGTPSRLSSENRRPRCGGRGFCVQM